MVVTLDNLYIAQNLLIVQGNSDLAYPQVDSSPTPDSPDAPVYINTPYPEIADEFVRPLWVENTGLLLIQGNYEPIYPAPDEQIYINTPYLMPSFLGFSTNRTSFDGYTPADYLWNDVINGEVSFTGISTVSFEGAIAIEGEVEFDGIVSCNFLNEIIINYTLSALLSPIKQYLTKIEWLDWNENFIADYTVDVLDGSLRIDSSRDVRRTFSMTINNSTGLYIPNGTRTNMGIKVKIQRGIQTSSATYWWNRGIYVLTDPTADHKGSGKTVSLNGSDKWALLDGSLGGTLIDTTVIANGTNVADAIRAVATLAGETKFAFDICTVTTPYTVTKEAGTNIAELLKELALIPSWDLYYDINGYLRFTPLIDPLQKQVVADLSVDGIYRKCYIDSSYSPEWSKIKNYWKVIGYSDSDTGIIYDGFSQNNNPYSPTNTATPPNGIGIKAEVLTDTNLTTDSLCEQRSGYELRKNLSKIDRSSHNIMPLPFLNEGDCVQLEDATAGIIDDKYEIQTITEPLGLGLMQIETWRCASVFEVVASDNFQLGLGTWLQLGTGAVDIYAFTGDNCLRKTTNADPNGGYRLLDKTCTDFELVVNTRRDLTGSGTNSYSVVDSSGTGYGISLDYSNNILILQERTAWVASTLATVTITSTLTSWYTLRLNKIGSNLFADIHTGKTLDFSNPLKTVSGFDATTTSFDRTAVNGGNVFYTDNVVVRKLL